METFSVIIDDAILKKVIAKLIDRSASFSYDPLADGKSKIEVKPENEDWLTKMISKLKGG